MAEVTVKQLAEVVGIPAEKLLKQMKEAGLAHGDADETVTDNEKQQLLAHLKKSHGGSDSDKKITLKRKSVSKLKVSGSQGRSKTVNVEVRKKRTYIKRSVVLENEQAKSQEVLTPEPEAETVPETTVDDGNKAAFNEGQELQHAPVDAESTAEASGVATDSVEDPQELARAAADYVPSSRTKTSAKRAIPDVVKSKTSAKKPKTKTESDAQQEKQQRRRKEEEAKRKADDRQRREAEEKARALTLEDAKRIAEELAKRESSTTQPDEPVEEEDQLVKQAFEESIALEEKRTKRTRRPSLKAKLKQGKRGVQHGFTQPTQPIIREVQIGETILVADLANQMSVKGSELVKALMKMGVMATVNQDIDQDTAQIVTEEMGHKFVLVNENQIEDNLVKNVAQEQSKELGTRAPVVTIMGHVDHGKTSLLDYIRRAKVADGEAGGITQHIGAYHVDTDKGMITFLDTPGHAAFTAMRARGAKSTDIVILVVAADDGMMPQTEEAVDHARAAGVPIIVAVNKIDKEEADPDRVKNELATKKELIPEDWGGETQYISVSAHSGEGVDSLLESILLQAELLELSAPLTGPATGVVIDSRLDRGRGAVTSLLVQGGQLNHGDMILAGPYFGRVRAMIDENGKPITSAGPSIPVEILGLAGTPEAGDEFLTVPDEKKAKEVAEFRSQRQRQQKLARQQKTKLENIFDTLKTEDIATINIILKTDVRGSLEALQGALAEIGNEEVQVVIVGSGVGAINESDVNLALTSNAIVIGFNVRADVTAKKLCQEEDIELRYYSVIYDIIEDMKAALSGLLEPERREQILGVAEVKDVFRSSKFGAAAGCMVVEGTLYRNKRIRVLRDDVVVYDGELNSLRRFKDDVSEVRSGTECGVAVKSYNDIKAGDKIEAYEVTEIARSL